MEVSALELGVLCAAALAAGTVDAIAGGGGLLTLPAMLAVGLPPRLAIGTNKGQSVFGTLAAMTRFAHAGLLDRRRARATFPAGLAGAVAGALLLTVLEPALLRPLVLVLLVAVAAFLTFRPRAAALRTPTAPRHPLAAAALIAFGIAAYDGFFGPGTGTFLILAFVALLGETPTRASADAKVVNFASNLAALAVFAAKDLVVWRVALPMAGFQLLGGFLGAHLGVRGGDGLVRRIVLVVVLGTVAKVAWDLFAA